MPWQIELIKFKFTPNNINVKLRDKLRGTHAFSLARLKRQKYFELFTSKAKISRTYLRVAEDEVKLIRIYIRMIFERRQTFLLSRFLQEKQNNLMQSEKRLKNILASNYHPKYFY